jgi:hypothetical protein
MEPVRLAFSKVKQDINLLEREILRIKLDLKELNNSIQELRSLISAFVLKFNPTDIPTIQQINPTFNRHPTDNPTVPQEIEGLKTQNLTISTRNEGVPTDRQTIQQTDQQTQKTSVPTNSEENIESNIKKASEIFDSLDNLKKEIRLKFKQLTNQEILVFSTIYQLEEKDPQNTTYKNIAHILNLSESSVRDYTLKIIKKGISIKKHKINNKKVLLSISSELKKIASLSTILQLREL